MGLNVAARPSALIKTRTIALERPKPLRAHEVQAIRKELGLTQGELADALGMASPETSRPTINAWESARRPVPGPVGLALTYLLEKHRGSITHRKEGK